MASKHFIHKDADYRILADNPAVAEDEIRLQRRIIEEHIQKNPEFLRAMTPLPLTTGAPGTIRRMLLGAHLTGTGPMAGVAGIIAEMSARKARESGSESTLVDNGGDLFIISATHLSMALYAGKDNPFNSLAFRVEPAYMPVAVCSSSGRMGHSHSFGSADLVTVFSSDGALADCAATMGGNMVHSAEDLEKAVNHVMTIPGIRGVAAIYQDRIALSGTLPELFRHNDSAMGSKVTHSIFSNYRSQDEKG